MLDALPGAEKTAAVKDTLLATIEDFNKKHEANAVPVNPESTAVGPQSEEPLRTMCRPQFSDSDQPLNLMSTRLAEEILDVAEFESKKEWLGATPQIIFLDAILVEFEDPDQVHANPVQQVQPVCHTGLPAVVGELNQ